MREKGKTATDITNLFNKFNEITMRDRLSTLCSSEEVEKHMRRRCELVERDDKYSEEWIEDYNQFHLDMLCLEMSDEDAKAFLKEANRRVDAFDEMIDNLSEEEASEAIASLADMVADEIASNEPKSVLENDFAMREKAV